MPILHVYNFYMKLKSLFNKLNISNRDSNPVITNHNCSYCHKPFTEKLWCKECDSFWDNRRMV